MGPELFRRQCFLTGSLRELPGRALTALPSHPGPTTHSPHKGLQMGSSCPPPPARVWRPCHPQAGPGSRCTPPWGASVGPPGPPSRQTHLPSNWKEGTAAGRKSGLWQASAGIAFCRDYRWITSQTSKEAACWAAKKWEIRLRQRGRNREAVFRSCQNLLFPRRSAKSCPPSSALLPESRS